MLCWLSCVLTASAAAAFSGFGIKGRSLKLHAFVLQAPLSSFLAANDKSCQHFDNTSLHTSFSTAFYYYTNFCTFYAILWLTGY
jgi:endo-1,4-beta-D-glucanase Y